MRKALLALPLGMAGLPVYMTAPALYNNLGFSLTTIGLLMMAMRLIDVFCDPLIGKAIDKGHNLMPYALAGLIVGMPLLFVVPYVFTPHLYIMCLSTLLISLSLSVMSISLYAYHHGQETRVDLANKREALLVGGVVLGAFLPPLLTQFLGERWGMASFVLLFIAILTLSYRPFKIVGHDVSFSFNNKPLLRVLFLVLINGIPTAITSVLFFYFTQYVVKTAFAPVFLLLFFMSGVLAMPFWLRLSKQWGELTTLILTIGLSPLVFMLAYLVGEGNVWLFALVCISSGILFGGDAVLLPLLISKTIGENKGGLVFGLNAFLTKLTNGLAVGMVLPFIVALGFDIGANDNANAIKIGYILIPVAFKLLSLAFIVYLKRISK